MNEIISGKYSGRKILIDSERKVAFLSENYIYLAKNNLRNVNIINSSNTSIGNPIAGAIVAGAAGAIIASATSYEILLELNWRDGQTSVAKVNKDTFEAITVGARKLYSDEQFERLTQRQKEKANANASSGGCYIATAVYGSYDCPQVWTLRRFRDCALTKTWYGRVFIHTYYAISPTLVKWFGHTDWFKYMWKGTLDRMVANLNASGVENTPYEDKAW